MHVENGEPAQDVGIGGVIGEIVGKKGAYSMAPGDLVVSLQVAFRELFEEDELEAGAVDGVRFVEPVLDVFAGVFGVQGEYSLEFNVSFFGASWCTGALSADGIHTGILCGFTLVGQEQFSALRELDRGEGRRGAWKTRLLDRILGFTEKR